MGKRINISILLILFFFSIGKGEIAAKEPRIKRDTCTAPVRMMQDTIRKIYHWVAMDSQMPDKEETLMLIEYHYDDPVKLIKLLRYLNESKPYKYIVKHILPRLNKRDIEDTLSIAKLVLKSDTLPSDKIKRISEAEIASVGKKIDKGEQLSEPETVLAIKNNLLYDLALAPNLEVELPIGRRWSLNTEYKCPWWLNNRSKFCYQLLSGGVEARYWLGNRRTHSRLIGHFFGVYIEGGRYDFQFGGDTGVQGKYYAASGISYGYTRRLANRLAIEFSLGIGYLTTEYRKYTTYEGDLIWKTSGKYNFMGPTKAKVSLVWLIKSRR